MDDHHESAIDRMLRRGAAGPSTPATSVDCLDGEALAAWMAQALPAHDAARMEAHLADCSRCQHMVALFVRTEPPPSAPIAEAWWRRLQIRWLVPLATAALVVAVWVAVPRDAGEVPAPLVVVERDDAAKAGPAAGAPPAASAPRTPEPLTRPNRSEDALRVAPARKEPLAEAVSKERLAAAGAQPASGTAGSVADARARQEIAAGALPPPPAATAAAETTAAAAPPPARPTAAAPAPAERPTALQERVIVTNDAPALRSRPPAGFDVVAADRTTRWRIVGGSRVQRASPERATDWQAIDFTADAPLTAGHSPMANVLWLVGERGTVYVTTNGVSFTRVPFVEQVDLATVVAVDGRRASVTTTGGRVWRTLDGGQSWLPQ